MKNYCIVNRNYKKITHFAVIKIGIIFVFMVKNQIKFFQKKLI